MLILLAVGIQFRSCMVELGRRVVVGKKRGCGMRLSVSKDFGGYKEAPFSAAPGMHREQLSAVMSVQGDD